ncbi:MAG TPA: DUF4382 domain-containing protein [Gemmatimonadaceae bacterium]|jgi:hypothetical protein
MLQRLTRALLLTAVLAFAACSGDSVTGARLRPGQGMLAVRLTDAPLPIDSVKEVNIFVERIDARRKVTDSAEINDDIEQEDGDHDSTSADSVRHDGDHDEDSDSTKWVTIATPNQVFNLLTLRNGVTAFLGATPVDTGLYRAVRLVIDPARSNIVLKDGTVLSATSSPGIEFEHKGHHGLFVELEDMVEVSEGGTTTLTLDLKLDQSIILRGMSLRDGFFFRAAVAGWTHKRDH